MKRIRTWAWPDLPAASERMRRAGWGQSYWKQIYQRKQLAAAQRHLQRQLAGMSVMRLVPVDPALDSAPAPAATVVH